MREVSPKGDLPAENAVDAGKDEVQSAAGDFAEAIGQDVLVQRDDERDVSHRVLRQTRLGPGERYISRGISPFEVAGKRNTDDGADAAAVECVALDHDNRPPVSGRGPGGFFEVCPPDFGLFDYHSTRRMTRRAARLVNDPDSSPTASTT